MLLEEGLAEDPDPETRASQIALEGDSRCGSPILREIFAVYVGEDDPQNEEEYDVYRDSFYPERAILTPKPFAKLPKKLAQIYSEAITCFNCQAPILCAAGLRALLEGVCDNKKVKGTNLADKIEHLEFVPLDKNIIKRLHHFRFAGNDAVHELRPPAAKQLELAIAVMEDLLTYLYNLGYKSSALREKRAPGSP